MPPEGLSAVIDTTPALYRFCDRCRSRPDFLGRVEEAWLSKRLVVTFDPPSDGDTNREAFNRVAQWVGIAKLEDLCSSFLTSPGEIIPTVEPREEVTSHIGFDGAIIAVGLKTFIRSRLPDDWPVEAIDPPPHTLIREVSSGLWFRVLVQVESVYEMN
jgi:hypothetical protein